MTNYYEVWVASQSYHSNKPLTYSFESPLPKGAIVELPLRNKKTVAVVIAKASKPGFATKEITQLLYQQPLPIPLLRLIHWMTEYYPAPFGQIVSLFLPNLSLAKKTAVIDEAPNKAPAKLPPLTPEQEQAVGAIAQNPKSTILHGDTGSGKTRVYLELTRQCLAQGRCAIILSPEIGLTTQITQIFDEAFPGRTVLMHSELTPKERRSAWQSVLESPEPLVVIGPRSALFMPLANVGMIVIDEFHETSYKQEQAPHYLASRVAAKLAELHEAQLVLGSATPLVGDYYTFQTKGLPIVRMKQQAISQNTGAQKIEIVDLKDRSSFKQSPWLSDVLIQAIDSAIKNSQQALVFLNRRGTARLIICQSCGWRAVCPNCDLPLTYHGDQHVMQCHTCGYNGKTPTFCPECSSKDIIFRTMGTKAITEEVQRIFPQATIQRFDSDNLKAERLDQHYDSVRGGQIDILVGTQVLGKGLDLPKLAVVGVITAETSLSFPDYTAEERTYQLLYQVLGRTNRGHIPGSAIIQAYEPDSQLLQAVTRKDYESFYARQIEERKLYSLPPFRFVLKLSCSRATNASAKQNAQNLARRLTASKLPIEVIGPTPSFIEKSHGKYNWQIIVKSTRRPALVEVIKKLPANWVCDLDPINLL